MKNEYNHLDRPSLLYSILSEMVFLNETRRITDHVTKLLTHSYKKVRSVYNKFIKNESNQAFLLLSGYMTFSTMLLVVAYKLILIF